MFITPFLDGIYVFRQCLTHKLKASPYKMDLQR